MYVWYSGVHSQKCAGCKSVDILRQICYDKLISEYSVRLHGLRKLVTSCQQSCCKLIFKNSTGLLQVVSTSCNKSANDKLQKALLQLDKDCCNLLTSCNNPLKLTTC